MEKDDCGRTLEESKEEFKKLKEKYSLPEFEKLSEDFDVEKITEKESSFILRDIRRTINERLTSYLHLFETLMNPSSPPYFIFSILKNSTEEDKAKIKEIYKVLSKYQVRGMKLDTIYSEKNEAEFIKEIYEEWQTIKKQIFSLLENFDKELEENNSESKGYFG